MIDGRKHSLYDQCGNLKGLTKSAQLPALIAKTANYGLTHERVKGPDRKKDRDRGQGDGGQER